MRASDDFPINIIPKNDTEKYILEEAKLWLDENILKSSIGIDEHIQNVINLGRDITYFLIDIMKAIEINKNMYTHFLLAVITKLYEGEIRFEGYCPPDWCINMFIQLWDNGGFELIDKAIDERNDGV